MILELVVLLLTGIAWGCGWYCRGLTEDDRREARRFAKWERKRRR